MFVLPVCIVASWYYLLLLHVICASGLVFVLNFLEIDDILVLMSEGKKGKNKDKNDDWRLAGRWARWQCRASLLRWAGLQVFVHMGYCNCIYWMEPISADGTEMNIWIYLDWIVHRWLHCNSKDHRALQNVTLVWFELHRCPRRPCTVERAWTPAWWREGLWSWKEWAADSSGHRACETWPNHIKSVGQLAHQFPAMAPWQAHFHCCCICAAGGWTLEAGCDVRIEACTVSTLFLAWCCAFL